MSEARHTETTEDQTVEAQTTVSEADEKTANASEIGTATDSSAEDEPTSEPTPSADEFARLKAEYEARYDRMLRTIAEFENSKKRTEREKEDFLKYALESFVKDLIPVLDSVERAINAAKESKDFDALVEGIQMIYKQLLGVLEKRGVTPIEAVGEPFDPTQHEALIHMESEFPENQVIQELQRGYMLHNRVIRPSMVSVSKGKGEGDTSDE